MFVFFVCHGEVSIKPSFCVPVLSSDLVSPEADSAVVPSSTGSAKDPQGEELHQLHLFHSACRQYPLFMPLYCVLNLLLLAPQVHLKGSSWKRLMLQTSLDSAADGVWSLRMRLTVSSLSVCFVALSITLVSQGGLCGCANGWHLCFIIHVNALTLISSLLCHN